MQDFQKIGTEFLGRNRSSYGKTAWNKGKVGAQVKSEESKAKVSRPVLYNGVKYYGIKQAARANNTTDYFIRKSCQFLD
jgi:hypothetical protein